MSATHVEEWKQECLSDEVRHLARLKRINSAKQHIIPEAPARLVTMTWGWPAMCLAKNGAKSRAKKSLAPPGAALMTSVTVLPL